jgi:hypothetical protein
MIANFYLMAESFAQNESLTSEIIEDKIKRLSEDVTLIHKYKDNNKLYTNYTDLYPQIFYETYTVQDFVCNPQELKQKGIDRDIINSLQKILDKSTDTKITSSEVISDLIHWNDAETCHGIIAFHKIEGLDESFQIIYGVDGWLKFRRYYLSIYPKNNIFFIDECTKYFPNLYLHERNKETVAEILNNCPKKIVYHLSALNDEFKEIDSTNLNRSQVLEQFSIKSKLDETASLEGNASRKPALTFSFLDEKNKTVSVCCEPHLKLCHNDNYPGDKSYSTDRRIYFHEGITTIEKGKILIGHIGDHL